MDCSSRKNAIFSLAPDATLFLASSSPRRQAMLKDIGLDFTLIKLSHTEPLPETGESGSDFAKRAALAKCQAAATQNRNTDAIQIFLAADTVVCIDNLILGKPENPANALEMLKRLNGKIHEVHTGMAIIIPDAEDDIIKNFTVSTRVEFAQWPESVLASYVASGESADKAGAYAIQGKGAFLVKNLEGSWTNVVGLPLSHLVKALLDDGLLMPA